MIKTLITSLFIILSGIVILPSHQFNLQNNFQTNKKAVFSSASKTYNKGRQNKPTSTPIPTQSPSVTPLPSTGIMVDKNVVKVTLDKVNARYGLVYGTGFKITSIDATGWQIRYTEPTSGQGFYESSGGIVPGGSFAVRSYINSNKSVGIYTGSATVQYLKNNVWYNGPTVSYTINLVDSAHPVTPTLTPTPSTKPTITPTKMPTYTPTPTPTVTPIISSSPTPISVKINSVVVHFCSVGSSCYPTLTNIEINGSGFAIDSRVRLTHTITGNIYSGRYVGGNGSTKILTDFYVPLCAQYRVTVYGSSGTVTAPDIVTTLCP